MAEQAYLDLLKELTNAPIKENRTGVAARSLFGRQIRFDLREGFPLLTTKKVHFKSVVHELLWFLAGDTNIKYLNDNGVRIWDEWADENGDLGPIYGKQWRAWADIEVENHPYCAGVRREVPIDQLADVIAEIKKNPDSRRLVVSAWNVADLPYMALAPCHCLFQFNVRPPFLDCQLYQRSADIFLGVPFNIASYALLTHMVAQETGYIPGDFIHTFGDVHLYNNHLGPAVTQLMRRWRDLPTIKLADKPIFDLRYDDITLEGYDPWPAIKAEVAV